MLAPMPMRTLFLALAALPLLAAAAPWTGPYKDVTRGLGSPTPLIATPAWHRNGDTLFWAFATGECGQERWGEFDTDAFARANVAHAVQQGQRYVVSTGGALGIFTCGTDEGLARFVARYDSPMLLGLDFDIEGAQTPEQIDALVQGLAALHRQRPALRITFTLATHAGSDHDRRSLNATGVQVLQAMRRHGLHRAIVNLMVMNYGEADPRWCVVRQGRCDMGRSAVQAVRNLHRLHGVPLHRIAVTAMPGENDVAGNVFTLADARRLAGAAQRLGLAGVHHWSLDRDQPCPVGEPRVSPACHALPGVAPGRFGRALGSLPP
jgi:chitinase